MSKIKSKKYIGVYYTELLNKDKSFFITYKDLSGKKIWQKIGLYSEGIREDYCNAKRNEALNFVRNNELPPSIIKKKKKEIITFDTIANQYFDARIHTRKDTEKERQRYINHLKSFIGHKDINDLTATDIEKIKLSKIGKLADNYVNQLIFMVSTIIRDASKKGVFKNPNPAQNIDNIKVDNKRERYLTKNEIEKLIEKLQDYPELLLFTKLSLNTGGRLNTILSIRKKDLNLEHNSVTLTDHKNVSTYTGYYNDELKTYLEDYVKTLQPNDTLISSHQTTISNKMRQILNELFNIGLDGDDRKNRVVIHTLRHTFASHLAIKGVPILTIQKLMNHKDIKMTLRYAKLAPDSGKEVIKDLYL
ncbi:MAG: site-specific integrase [Arcobacteraceae bacterium]|jgi:integrase|nr:site-specific integrase [Arcobacteraceae bacterium]